MRRTMPGFAEGAVDRFFVSALPPKADTEIEQLGLGFYKNFARAQDFVKFLEV